VLDTKATTDLLDDQVVDIKRGPGYRTGGIYFTNHYPKHPVGAMGPILYPLMWAGGTAMFLALLLSIVVFVQGTRQAVQR